MSHILGADFTCGKEVFQEELIGMGKNGKN